MTQATRAICVACLMGVGLLGSSMTSPTFAQVLECQGSQKPQQVVDLLFGRKIGDHVTVSEGAWRRFVAREITTRFPDGSPSLTGEANGLTPTPDGSSVSRAAWS